ncbi:MAG: hypothetical protein V7776_08515 [Halopseudomonas aestusnigri]
MLICLMHAIIYRWDLKPSAEEDFVSAWRDVTLCLKEKEGSGGSRLHKSDDGSYLAYALWDSLEHRTEAFESGIPHQDQIMQMRDCTKQRHPEMKLVVTDDLLLPIPQKDPNVFASFYHWMINPEVINPFKEIWHRVTLELRSQYDVQGSRLHLASDAHWVAYAVWPSKEMRDHAFAHPVVTEAEKEVMRSALTSKQIEVPMTVLEDHLSSLSTAIK